MLLDVCRRPRRKAETRTGAAGEGTGRHAGTSGGNAAGLLLGATGLLLGAMNAQDVTPAPAPALPVTAVARKSREFSRNDTPYKRREGWKVSLGEAAEWKSERTSERERGGGAETAKNEGKNCVSGARKAHQHLSVPSTSFSSGMAPAQRQCITF